MRQPITLRRTLRFALAAVLVAPLASAALGAIIGCGPYDVTEVWVCHNPVTGKDDFTIYDANHYVNGRLDPCHCYDPCGPQATCPIVVDAGPPPQECPAGDAGP